MPFIQAEIVPRQIAELGVFFTMKLPQTIASLALSTLLLPATVPAVAWAEEGRSGAAITRGEDREAIKSFDSNTLVTPVAWADGGRSGPMIARGEEREAIKSLDITERPDRLGHFYGNTVRRRTERASEPARRGANRGR